jgi:hypothetical protein
VLNSYWFAIFIATSIIFSLLSGCSNASYQEDLEGFVMEGRSMVFFKGYSIETVVGSDTVVLTNAVPGTTNDIRVKIMNPNGLALTYSIYSDSSEASFYDSPPSILGSGPNEVVIRCVVAPSAEGEILNLTLNIVASGIDRSYEPVRISVLCRTPSFLTFDIGTASGVTGVAQTVAYATGETVTLDALNPGGLSRAGNVLIGWNTVDGATTVLDSVLMAGNVTVYPVWAIAVSDGSSFADIKNALGGAYALTQDITLDIDSAILFSDDEGSGNENNAGRSFTGILDGQGHTITLNILTYDPNDFIGVFARIGSSGVVRNLGVAASIVTDSTNSYVGALAGINWGTITHCWSGGTVKGYHRVGGLVGTNKGTIDECYSVANVDVRNQYGGGLAGNNIGTIRNSYARGTVNDSDASNATSEATADLIGGLVAHHESETAAASIVNCYAATANSFIASSYYHVNGLIGVNNDNSEVTSSYYADGMPASDAYYGNALTLAQMTQSGNFASWDFDEVWAIGGATNEGYPYLRWFGSNTVLPY